MIRVAQVVGKMNGGGVEQAVMNYYRHIDRTRVQFDFLVEEGSNMVPYDEIKSLGGRVFTVESCARQMKYQRTLQRLIRSEGWPVLHSHINALSVFPLKAACRVGVPVRIAHSHSTAGNIEPLRDMTKWALKRSASKYATERYACSHYAGAWLFGSERSFDVIPNAIEIERFRFNGNLRSRVRRQLNANNEQLVVGHIGRFAPQKNHMFLLQAFRELLDYDDAILVLVGDGPLQSKIKKTAFDMGLSESVRFLGYQEDASELYHAFDVFAFPSFYEGLGMVGVEAQCAGLRCAVSDRVPGEIDVTGNVAFLPIDDPKCWASALRFLGRAPRAPFDYQRIASAGYDIEKASLDLLNRYETLCAEQGVSLD